MRRTLSRSSHSTCERLTTALPWLLIAAGMWLGYQLVRQNGRILLRLEAIEKQIEPRAEAKREAGGLPVGTAKASLPAGQAGFGWIPV